MTDLVDSTADDDIVEQALADSEMGAPENEELGIQPGRFGMFLGVLALMALLGGWQLLLIVVFMVGFIILHEAGHFFTARWSGMKATEFFIGFGARIFAVKRGETTYGLKALPFGAYVRIIGMNNLDEVEPGDEGRAYRSQVWHKRFLTVAAGPASHFLLAIVFSAMFLYNVGERADEGWEVAAVVPFSAAEEAGVERGDRIVAINGVDTTEFEALSTVVPDVRGQTVVLDVVRDGEALALDARIGERLTEAGSAGYNGLYIGDLIVGFEGRPVASYDEFAELASQRLGDTVEVEVVYGATTHTELITIDSVATDGAVSGFLGVARGDAFDPVGVSEAITQAPAVTWDFTSTIAVRFFELFTSSDGLRGLFALPTDPVAPDADALVEVRDPNQIRPFNGPDENRIVSIVGAVDIGQQLVDEGVGAIVAFFLLFNISIGMFNLLPLLPFDGGHMAVATYEKIRSFGGRTHRVDAAKLIPLTYAVVAFALLIGGIAIVRDIVDPIQL